MPVQTAETGTGIVALCVGGDDGETLFVAGEDGRVLSFDTKTMKQFGAVALHKAAVSGLQWTEEGLVSCSCDGTIVIVTSTFEIVRTLKGNSGSLRCVLHSGDTVYAGGSDGFVRSWQRDSNPPTTSKAHRDVISQMTFLTTEEGTFLFTSSYDKTIKSWDVTSGSFLLQKTFTGHSNHVKCFAYSSSLLFSGSRDETMKVWDTATARCVLSLDLSNFVNCMTVSKGCVVVGTSGGQVFAIQAKAVAQKVFSYKDEQSKLFEMKQQTIQKKLDVRNRRLDREALEQNKKRLRGEVTARQSHDAEADEEDEKKEETAADDDLGLTGIDLQELVAEKAEIQKDADHQIAHLITARDRPLNLTPETTAFLKEVQSARSSDSVLAVAAIGERALAVASGEFIASLPSSPNLLIL